MTYAVSTDGEMYFGKFETLEEAIESAKEHKEFWVGEARKPRQPESFIDIDYLLDGLGDGDDDWCGDWSEWDGPNREQADELEKEFKAVMSAWLDRHNLRPTWFCIDKSVKYVTVDGVTRKAIGGE